MHRSLRGAIQFPDANSELEHKPLERERKLLELTRQLQHRSGNGKTAQLEDLFSLTPLQTALDTDRVLIDYTTIDDKLLERLALRVHLPGCEFW